MTDQPAGCRAEAPPLMEMRNISKTFGGISALSEVSIAVHGGEVHALMGENGAGKSTLMKVLAGAHRADAGGEILIDGQPVDIHSPMDAQRHGIAVIYQELSLAPNLTVAENMFLGREISRSAFSDRAAQRRAAGPVLDRLGADFRADDLTGTLSLGQRQLVEIGRALLARARVVVMDEPTTSLSETESARLFTIIDDLRREGLAIIYISHRMGEIYRLSDRVSVLRDGRYVGSLTRGELNAERLINMMVGRDISSFYTKQHGSRRSQRSVLAVENISDGARIRNCSLHVAEGEVVGIAGLVGSGRTELARLIFGADRKHSGTVSVDGRPVEISGPEDAIAHGIAYLTEDRKGLGLFLEMSVTENINISVIREDSRVLGLLNRRQATRRTDAAIRKLDLRGARRGTRVGQLSGGNQQKALLARLLETKPRVLILDEPTRGVDVGAKSEIYRLIDKLAGDGMAVLVISSELAEIIGIADRVLVMHEGAIVGELDNTGPQPVTQEAIMAFSSATPDQEAMQ